MRLFRKKRVTLYDFPRPTRSAAFEGLLDPARYAPSHDERVRLAALDMAINVRSDLDAMPADIVERAEAFRKFLDGGSK